MEASASPSGPLALAGMSHPESEPRSVAALVEAHFAFVWRTLRRLGLDAADADDGAQHVCLVLARRLSDIEPGRERAFMFGAAVKVASRLRRSHGRRRLAGDAELDALQCALPGPEAELDQRRARALLDDVLDGLGDELRAVFVLHELEQLTMLEIARLLELPSGTVASRLRRAREIFNRKLAALRAQSRRESGE